VRDAAAGRAARSGVPTAAEMKAMVGEVRRRGGEAGTGRDRDVGERQEAASTDEKGDSLGGGAGGGGGASARTRRGRQEHGNDRLDGRVGQVARVAPQDAQRGCRPEAIGRLRVARAAGIEVQRGTARPVDLRRAMVTVGIACSSRPTTSNGLVVLNSSVSFLVADTTAPKQLWYLFFFLWPLFPFQTGPDPTV